MLVLDISSLCFHINLKVRFFPIGGKTTKFFPIDPVWVPFPKRWKKSLHYDGRFRDSSAQNHFGPGLLGPDVSAHFSIRDCSAHFIGTARPIFLFFIYLFWGGGGDNLLFYSVYVHQNKIQETLLNVRLIFRQGNREMIWAMSWENLSSEFQNTKKRPKYMWNPFSCTLDIHIITLVSWSDGSGHVEWLRQERPDHTRRSRVWSGRSWRSHETWADPSDQVTKVMMFLLYTYIKLTTTNSILTISSRNGKIDTVWCDVAASCQTTSRQNFVDVTISKHVTAEQENVFIVFNFVSLI